MPEVFEHRRPASPEKIAQLVASFDASGLELQEAEVTEIATLAELGALPTVLVLLCGLGAAIVGHGGRRLASGVPRAREVS